jgi:hypothetical protein
MLWPATLPGGRGEPTDAVKNQHVDSSRQQRVTMSYVAAQHRFHTGRLVRFTTGAPTLNRASGAYKVTQQLPTSGGELQYRVKSALEQHERVAKEDELEPV